VGGKRNYMNKNVTAPTEALNKRQRARTSVQTDGTIKINPRFYHQVLRSVGYDTYTAISELVDNALDAQASVITIDYDSKAGELIIQDNGRGMSADELTNAMNLGSNQSYSQEHVGYFGSGMKTAIMNLLAEDGQVHIQTNNGKGTSMVIWQPRKDFLNYQGPIDVPSGSLALGIGTRISLQKVPRIYLNHLKRNLGAMFYPSLKTDTVKIVVDGSTIHGTDPLYRDSEKTLKNYVTAKVLGHEIKIEGVMLHSEQEKHNWDALDGKEKEEGRFSYAKAGAYVNYGGRYIELGGMIGVLTNHPKFTTFRFEFTIPKELTETFDVKFNKTQGLNLSPKKEKNEPLADLIQKIKDLSNWQIEQRQKLKITNSNEEDQKELEQIAEKLNKAAQRARVRRPVDPSKEKKQPENTNPAYTSELADEASADKAENLDQPGDQSVKKPQIYKYQVFDLKFDNLDSAARFWNLGFNNDRFTITINDNHVFYSKFWVNLDETARTSIAFLLAAIAEGQYDDIKHNAFCDTKDKREQDPIVFWERFWSDVSMKLRHLLIS
jgi:hypothetical protein